MVTQLTNLRSIGGMSSQAGVPASDITTTSKGCEYSDGSQYNVCQVEAKGWPMPKFFGGKGKGKGKGKKTKKLPCWDWKGRCKMDKSLTGGRRARRAGSSCSMSKTGGKSMRARKAGGLITQAIVPFGILAAQKKSQRRHKHAHGKKHRKKSFSKKR
jgi:hypothetical protein